VPGEHTDPGLPCIVSTDDLEIRIKSASDGRDRRYAEQIGSYPIGVREIRRQAEQIGIDDAGGIDVLDNMRNEIREK